MTLNLKGRTFEAVDVSSVIFNLLQFALMRHPLCQNPAGLTFATSLIHRTCKTTVTKDLSSSSIFGCFWSIVIKILPIRVIFAPGMLLSYQIKQLICSLKS